MENLSLNKDSISQFYRTYLENLYSETKTKKEFTSYKEVLEECGKINQGNELLIKVHSLTKFLHFHHDDLSLIYQLIDDYLQISKNIDRLVFQLHCISSNDNKYKDVFQERYEKMQEINLLIDQASTAEEVAYQIRSTQSETNQQIILTIGEKYPKSSDLLKLITLYTSTQDDEEIGKNLVLISKLTNIKVYKLKKTNDILSWLEDSHFVETYMYTKSLILMKIKLLEILRENNNLQLLINGAKDSNRLKDLSLNYSEMPNVNDLALAIKIINDQITIENPR